MAEAPMMVGPTMADAVTWVWEGRNGGRWVAELADGTELFAIHFRRTRFNYWLAMVGGTSFSAKADTPYVAKLLAVNEYRRRKGMPPLNR